MITEVPEVNLSIMHLISIPNLEDEQKFDNSLIKTMAKITAVLPNLEF